MEGSDMDVYRIIKLSRTAWKRFFQFFILLKEIDNDAQTLLDKFLNNPEYGLFKKMKELQLLKLQKLWDLKYSQPGSMIETFLEQLVFLGNFEKIW